MKIHWGSCDEQYWKDRSIELSEKYNKSLRTISTEEEYSKQLLKLNDEFAAKIQHLEQVISDYHKASLLQQAPVYVEMAAIPEAEHKPKRTRKA
jgi:hypothetical protein